MGYDIRIMPENFGGMAYKDITNMHPLALIAIVILGFAVLAVPRRLSILPMVILACFFSSVQKISLFGLDFDLLRIMIVFGVIRLMLRGEYKKFIWMPIDTVIVLWIISSIVVYSIQQYSSSAVINRLGFGFNAFGMYFLFRCLIRKWSDIEWIVSNFILISIPVMVFFLIENRTGHNLFSIFGGVPAITVIREGRLRCQGAFPHPIIAGCFWASLMPLFAAFWWKSSQGKLLPLLSATPAESGPSEQFHACTDSQPESRV